MNRRLLVAAFICLAISVAFATAATTSDDRLDADEDVYLQPHDGPNGAYAGIDGDGDLEITADRLNPQARTLVEDVFDIENRGDRVVWVWLTDESDAVTFRHGGASIEGVENRERLRSDETAVVGFFVDVPTTAGLLPENITVHAHTNVGLQIGGTVRDGQIRPGQSTEVGVTIQNTESETVETFLAVRAEHDGDDDTAVREDIVDVEGDATRETSYGLALPEEGEWTVYLNNEQIGTVTVAESKQSGGGSSRTRDRGKVSMSDLSVTPTEAASNETVTILVRIRNTHYGSRTHNIEFTIDDETVAERTAQLPSNSQLWVRYEHRFEEPGTYEVGVRGLESATVTVTEAPGPSEPEPTESEPTPAETPTEISTETPTPAAATEEITPSSGTLVMLAILVAAVAVRWKFRHHGS